MKRDITRYDFFKALTALPYVEAIFLYGSRARGDNAYRSDIDLAILCPTADWKQWKTVEEIIEEADTLLEIDCVRLDTLNHPDMTQQIEQDKVVLYQKEGIHDNA